KLGWSSPYAFPKFSILDPTYTYSVPRDQTVYGIVDTMSHALEQYFHAGGHTPLTDRMTEGLLQTVMEAAPIVLDNPNDADARETLLYAGTLALNGTLAPGIGGGDWSTHRLEHAVSALYDIPHAGGLAILFPAWLRFVSQKRPARVAELGWRVFGIDASLAIEEAAAATIVALSDFWSSLGAPVWLDDYGIDRAKIDQLVHRTTNRAPVGQYVVLTDNDVRTIFLDAYKPA
ncbi:MAG: NADH-dependent alcohol dehydrogenase, partial [Bacilli bacterium]